MVEPLFDFRNLENSALCLQHELAPNSICFGCGPANRQGLQLKSFVLKTNLVRQWVDHLSHQQVPSMLSSSVPHDRLVGYFRPASHHQAFSGTVNGGILGALLDCQMNWTACWNLMQVHQRHELPGCVTATYQVDFLAPSPSDGCLLLVAEIVELGERKASVRCELGPLNPAGDRIQQLTARGSGIFVAVNQDHPAHHRWTHLNPG